MTAQMTLAGSPAAVVERAATAPARNRGEAPARRISPAAGSASVPDGHRTSALEEAQQIYDACRAHALRAKTLAQVRERYDACDRAMVRLQREARQA